MTLPAPAPRPRRPTSWPIRPRRLSPLRLLASLLVASVVLVLAATPAAASLPTAAAPSARTDGSPGGAPGLAVEGSDHAYLRIDEPRPPVVSYANAGYRLEVRPAEDGGTEAVVEVDLSPLGNGGPFTPRPASDATGGGGDPVAALARRLTAGATTRYEAASAILGWMVHNVVSEETADLAREPRQPLGSGAPGADPGGAAGPPATGSAKRAETPVPSRPTSSNKPAPSGGRAASGAATGGATPRQAAPVEGGNRSPGGSVQGGAVQARPVQDTPVQARPAQATPVLEVLERGSGNADEVARLAVALLRQAGLEARTVRGRVIGAPEIGSPRGDHTWIEVRYPTRGWAFSDPLHYHHYVPSTYVRFADGAVSTSRDGGAATPQAGGRAVAAQLEGKGGAAPGTRGAGDGTSAPPKDGGNASPADADSTGHAPRLRLVERRDRRETVDLYPFGAPGITARKADPGQEAGALRVVVSGGTRGSAVLEGDGARTSKMLVGGESVFVGLEGGAYRLEVYLEGRPPIVRQLRIGERERRAVFLREPDGESRGAEPPAATGGRRPPPSPERRSRPRP